MESPRIQIGPWQKRKSSTVATYSATETKQHINDVFTETNVVLVEAQTKLKKCIGSLVELPRIPKLIQIIES